MYVYAYDTFIDSWFGWQPYDDFIEAHKDNPELIHEINALRWGSGALAKKFLG